MALYGYYPSFDCFWEGLSNAFLDFKAFEISWVVYVSLSANPNSQEKNISNALKSRKAFDKPSQKQSKLG